MALKLKTAPTIEPVTLSEVKNHLRLDTGTIADSLSTVQSILSGDHSTAASYSLKGSGVNVLNTDVLVILEAGVFGAGGTVDVKLQEADVDNDANYSDVSGGAFSQLTDSDDEAVYEKRYTGNKKYIRAVATVANATCDFGVSVVKRSPVGYEDTLISNYITAARRSCEALQGRSYITQTWDIWFDYWPEFPVKIPKPPLQEIVHIKYYDKDDTEYTWSTDEYMIDTNSDPGRVTLQYGKTIPTKTLRPIDNINMQFKSGYGDSASEVPEEIREAIKLLTAHFYENRENVTPEKLENISFGIKTLLGFQRIYWI